MDGYFFFSLGWPESLAEAGSSHDVYTCDLHGGGLMDRNDAISTPPFHHKLTSERVRIPMAPQFLPKWEFQEFWTPN